MDITYSFNDNDCTCTVLLDCYYTCFTEEDQALHLTFSKNKKGLGYTALFLPDDIQVGSRQKRISIDLSKYNSQSPITHRVQFAASQKFKTIGEIKFHGCIHGIDLIYLKQT